MQIRSVYLTGSYGYSLSERFRSGDLDLEILVDNLGICDACHYLSRFAYEATFVDSSKAPRTINVWVISTDKINIHTSSLIPIDVGFNASRGFSLMGTRFFKKPPPLIERLKMAYFYANLVLTIHSENDFSFLLRRYQEMYVILGQAVLIADAPSKRLVTHSNISDLDKNQISEVQSVLRRHLGSDPEVYAQRLREMTGVLDQYLEYLEAGVIPNSFVNTHVATILKDSVAYKQTIFEILNGLHQLQGEFIDAFPEMDSRVWVYQIMSTTNRFRTCRIQQLIPNFQDVDFSLAVSLATKGIDPKPLVLLWEGLEKNRRLNDDQKIVVARALARNPLTPDEISHSVFERYFNNEVVLTGFLDNWCCPRKITIFLSEGRGEHIDTAYRVRAERAQAINRIFVAQYSANFGKRMASLIRRSTVSTGKDKTPESTAYLQLLNVIASSSEKLVQAGVHQTRLLNLEESMSTYYDKYLHHAYGRFSLGNEQEVLALQIAEIIEEIALLYIGAYDLELSRFSEDDTREFMDVILSVLDSSYSENVFQQQFPL